VERVVDREPRGLRECARQDGVDGDSPRWSGVDEAVKRLSVVGLDGSEVLVTARGESTYILQPGKRRRKDHIKVALTQSGGAATQEGSAGGEGAVAGI
jgi:hypothetical protein